MWRRVTVCVFLGASILLPAESFALELGDPAPPLKIAEWIKGQPIEIKPAPAARTEKDAGSRAASAASGPIYLIEFWATWCPPCRASIPHLNELQKHHKDKGLIVVGVSDETPEVLKTFVKQMGDKIGYTIAADKRAATFRAYLGGFGVDGIPHAVLIDRQGRIVWHGSPFDAENVVKALVAGTYSLQARILLHEYFDTLFAAQKTKDSKKKDRLIREARDKGEKLITVADQDHEALDLLAWNILNLDWLKTRDHELAGNAIRKAMKLTDGKDPAVLDTYARLLWDRGDKSEALEHLKKAIKLTDDEQLKAVLSSRLKTYENQMN